MLQPAFVPLKGHGAAPLLLGWHCQWLQHPRLLLHAAAAAAEGSGAQGKSCLRWDYPWPLARLPRGSWARTTSLLLPQDKEEGAEERQRSSPSVAALQQPRGHRFLFPGLGAELSPPLPTL